MYKSIESGVCAPLGFLANGLHCGIRKNSSKLDLALIKSEVVCDCASVYTQNKVCGAPIIVTKENTLDGKACAIIVNSGNANTCNADGVEKARQTCSKLAQTLSIKPEDVIVASTGVIGQPLPIEKITSNIESLASGLSPSGSSSAALAIMTTDTVPKETAIEFTINEKICKIGSISKGTGMIHPNMATMLCFITTDVNISSSMLSLALKEACDESYNMISVDGDTSTNDMVSILASGLAQNQEICEKNNDYYTFLKALTFLCTEQAKKSAKDGEGATKLLECSVSNANSKSVAKKIAKSVITSSLFKAAMFGNDANWGRILCAIGYADCEFDITKVDVDLRSVSGVLPVCRNGAGVAFDEEFALVVLKNDTIFIDINLNDGDQKATAWGCDLTYDYVKINGDYRT